EAADVAHPVAVDLGCEARCEPDQLGSLGPFGFGFEPRGGVAAFFAARADRVDGAGVVPRTRLEPVVARRNCADGADVHKVAGDGRVGAFFLDRRDLAAVTAVGYVDLRGGVTLGHN